MSEIERLRAELERVQKQSAAFRNYLDARLKTVRASVAAERLAGNQHKLECELTALTELECAEAEFGSPTGARSYVPKCEYEAVQKQAAAMREALLKIKDWIWNYEARFQQLKIIRIEHSWELELQFRINELITQALSIDAGRDYISRDSVLSLIDSMHDIIVELIDGQLHNVDLTTRRALDDIRQQIEALRSLDLTALRERAEWERDAKEAP